MSIDEVATGEAWFGRRALERNLVDELKTSDEYLIDKCDVMDVFQVRYVLHKHKLDRLMEKVAKLVAPDSLRHSIPEEHIG